MKIIQPTRELNQRSPRLQLRCAVVPHRLHVIPLNDLVSGFDLHNDSVNNAVSHVKLIFNVISHEMSNGAFST